MKKSVKFVSLLLSLVLILGMIPGVAFAASSEEPAVQGTVASPRAAYGFCSICKQMTLRQTPGVHANSNNLVTGCDKFPTKAHMHRVVTEYTNWNCDSCGYWSRSDYHIIDSVCLGL